MHPTILVRETLTATALVSPQWLKEVRLTATDLSYDVLSYILSILSVSRLSVITILVLQVELAVDERVKFVVYLDPTALLVCNN